jgi:hypothetical protein
VTVDPRSDTLVVRHSLAVALSFEDVFSGTPVRAPLHVSIPALSWNAVARGDGTYRFVRTIGDVPTGTFDVEVIAPGGEYRSFEPVQITLPHVAPTPPRRQDWMIVKTLWPTRKLRLGPGETALVGRFETAGVPQASRKVRFIGQAAHTYSDENGELLAYFPDAKRDVLDSPPTVTLDVAIEVDNGAASVSPASVTIEMGTVLFQRFEIT